jgi:hypothetical protein
LTVAADFPTAQAGLIQPGAKVVISSELLGKSVDATIQKAPGRTETGTESEPGDAAGGASPGATSGESVTGKDGAEGGDPAGGPASDPAQALYSIVPDQPLGSEWAGQDVKVRVVSASTEGEVLAVPVTAIVSNSSGDTEVVVVDKGATSITDADPRRVQVTVGATGGGWAEVTPSEGEQLAEGDPVQLSAPASE